MLLFIKEGQGISELGVSELCSNVVNRQSFTIVIQMSLQIQSSERIDINDKP